MKRTRLIGPVFSFFLLYIVSLFTLLPLSSRVIIYCYGCITASHYIDLTWGLYTISLLIAVIILGLFRKAGRSAILTYLVGYALFCFLLYIVVVDLVCCVDRAKQKRTMADIRSIASALEAFAADEKRYPDVDSIYALAPMVEPKYIRNLPREDGWGNPFILHSEKDEYWVISYGLCGKPDVDSFGSYQVLTKTNNYKCDIVYANGGFIQWPEGIQN